MRLDFLDNNMRLDKIKIYFNFSVQNRVAFFFFEVVV